MSGGQKRAFMFAGVVLVILGCTQAFAAWPWSKKAQTKVDLREVMKAPAEYLGRQVTFECRYALRGKLFKQFNTRFNPNEHVNFAVWVKDAKLWEKAERRNVLPTIYIDKSLLPIMAVLKKVKRYDVIELTGQVVSTYAGLPWIRIQGLKVISKKDEVITDAAIAHIQRGLALLENKNGIIAARHFELAVTNGVPVQHKAFITSRTADALREAGEDARAIAKYKEAVELDGKDADNYLALAKLSLKNDQEEEAIEYSQKVLSLTAEYPEVHAIMGEANGRLGKYREGLEQCKLTATTPGIPPRERAMAYVRIARVQIQAEQYADAVRSYAKAIEDGPLAAEPWLRKEVGNLYESRFDAAGQVRNLSYALMEYKNASSLAKKADPEALFLAARVEYKRAKAQKLDNFAAAIEFLRQCAELDPAYPEALLLQGQIAVASGKPEEAEKHFRKFLELHGDDMKALVCLASVYEKQMGKKVEALGIYSRIIAKDATNREALSRHAALSEELGNPEAAKASYETLVELEPNELSFRYKLGMLALQTDDVKTATSNLQAAVDAPGMQGDAAKVALARIKKATGDSKSAETLLRQVLAGNQENTEAMSILAVVLADQKRNLDEALALSKKAYEQMQASPMAIDAYGWALTQSGNADEAIKILELIAEASRGRSLWYHLGVARYQQQNFSGAREALALAIGAKAPGEITIEAEAISSKAKRMLDVVRQAEAATRREAKMHEREAIRQAAIEQRKARAAARLAASAEASNDKAPESVEQAKEVPVEVPVDAAESEIVAEEQNNLAPEAADDLTVNTYPSESIEKVEAPEEMTAKKEEPAPAVQARQGVPAIKDIPIVGEAFSRRIKKETITPAEEKKAEIIVPANINADDFGPVEEVSIPGISTETTVPEELSALRGPTDNRKSGKGAVAPELPLSLDVPEMKRLDRSEATKREPSISIKHQEKKKEMPKNSINDLPDWAK